jgi:hypothetical protein
MWDNSISNRTKLNVSVISKVRLVGSHLHFTLPHTSHLSHYLTPPLHTTSHLHFTLPHTSTSHYLTPPYLTPPPQTFTSHYLTPFTLSHTSTSHYLTPPLHTTSHLHFKLPHTFTSHYLTPLPSVKHILLPTIINHNTVRQRWRHHCNDPQPGFSGHWRVQLRHFYIMPHSWCATL